MFESGSQFSLVNFIMKVRFGFSGWNISDWSQQASIVKPIDPVEGGALDIAAIFPRSSEADDFGFEQTDSYSATSAIIIIASVE